MPPDGINLTELHATPDAGLIVACLLDGQGGARALDWQAVRAWSPQNGPLWVHLDYSHPVAQHWLAESAGLDPVVAEALVTEETRPRSTAIGKGLLIALRGINFNPGAEPDDMVAIRLWVDADRMITTRRRKVMSVVDLGQQFERGKGAVSTADLLVELVDRLVWRMSDTVESLEEQVATLEDRVMDEGRGSALRGELADLRRQVITLRRYLSPQRDALALLVVEKTEWLDTGSRVRLREVSDRLVRHVEDLDAVRDRAAVAQEELQSRLSEQLNRRMYVLSVVAAVFLPLGFLTGLLGVNVGGIPGADNPRAFAEFALLLGVVLAVQLAVFRWMKWF